MEKIDKEATVKRIVAKCKKENIPFNVNKLNEEINKPNAEDFIKDAAMLVGVEPVYVKE
jgi:tagatose-1,6-bisphosphate aldolase